VPPLHLVGTRRISRQRGGFPLFAVEGIPHSRCRLRVFDWSEGTVWTAHTSTHLLAS
jgi:hypothetical protein